MQNITDIDDKIIVRAQERGVSINELTSQYIAAMYDDMRALSILPVDKQPRATEAIDDMIALIETLIAKGHAYVSDNGDVCYEVSTFADYGKLSNKDLDGLQSGVRIEVDQSKRSPLGFCVMETSQTQ